MDRDEILRREPRGERGRGGTPFWRTGAAGGGVIGFCVMTIVLLVFNLAAGQNSYSVYGHVLELCLPGGLGEVPGEPPAYLPDHGGADGALRPEFPWPAM